MPQTQNSPAHPSGRSFISLATIISILGVTTGVAALIVAMAINNGVQRDLRVSIVQARADKKKGPLRPGDEMELTITTTDPQGKPVSAEVSLAMVEQSLLAIFPSNLTPIDQFFRGQQRQTA
ncbi:MAG: hypothetical protein IIB59_05700 [Planctomycetes bacterium]|nr:hypothetical protein [Planctomycetota bacterium]